MAILSLERTEALFPKADGTVELSEGLAAAGIP
jgi:hypothetical protein